MESTVFLTPLAAAGISAVLWGTAMIADTLMIRDCYGARPAQPLVISSIFGGILGLFFSLFHALYVAPYVAPPFSAALAAFLAGTLITVATLFLFTALNSPDKDSAEVAAYTAIAPVVVLFLSGVFMLIGVPWPLETLGAGQWVGITIATLGLALLAAARGALTQLSWRYRGVLLLMLVFTALYYVVMDIALAYASAPSPGARGQDGKLTAFFGILPFYWLGLATGGAALFVRPERDALARNLRTITTYVPWIILLELFAMLSFAAEIYGLSGEHPALVGVISEMHLVLIFFVGYLLRRLNLATEVHFPPSPRPIVNVLALVCIATGIALALT